MRHAFHCTLARLTCTVSCVLAASSAAGQMVIGGRTVPYALREHEPVYMEAIVGESEGCQITGVRVDCAGLGLGWVELSDDGVRDDGVAGNNLWGDTVFTAHGAAWGAKALTILARDECGFESEPGVAFAVHVMGEADWGEVHDAHADAGELPATAQRPGRLGAGGPTDAVSAIWGYFGATNGRDVDMYRVRACDPSVPSRFIVQQAGTDIQLFLFDASGMGVAHHDGFTADLLAAVIDAQLGPGDYYIAVSAADRDPLSAGNLAIWLDEPRGQQHPPDGPGAGAPIIAWGGVPIPATANYNILVHNICQTALDCDHIDFNNDGLFPDTLDIADFITVFGGGVCDGQNQADPACNTDLDFNNDGLFPDTQDIAALLSVFSGGPCL